MEAKAGMACPQSIEILLRVVQLIGVYECNSLQDLRTMTAECIFGAWIAKNHSGREPSHSLNAVLVAQIQDYDLLDNQLNLKLHAGTFTQRYIFPKAKFLKVGHLYTLTE